MKAFQKLMMVLAASGLLTLFVACEEEGDFERAGEKIDRNANEVGEDAERGLDKAGDKLEEAGDDVKDAVD